MRLRLGCGIFGSLVLCEIELMGIGVRVLYVLLDFLVACFVIHCSRHS